jgi:adenylosuccinate lyase
MATENILMEAVKNGGDRQELHERIRVHSMAAAKVVKEEGRPNDLLERICADESFKLNKEQIRNLVNAKDFIGRAPYQVEEFINEVVDPLIEGFNNKEVNVQINV